MSKDFKDKMTFENGFFNFGISSKSRKTFIGKDGRIKFGDDEIDLHNYCEDQCKKKCNITPDYSLEEDAHCIECDCVVSGFYIFAFKLAMIEKLIEEE